MYPAKVIAINDNGVHVSSVDNLFNNLCYKNLLYLLVSNTLFIT